MSKSFGKNIAYSVIYGVDAVVIDDDFVQSFIPKSKVLSESSKVQGVYSDEGLYDFYNGFSSYKRVTKEKAAKVLGGKIVDYIID